jgi:hypothetical protein
MAFLDPEDPMLRSTHRLSVTCVTFLVALSTGCSSPEREAERNLDIQVPVEGIDDFLDENPDLVVRLGDAQALIGLAFAQAFGERPEADTMSLGEIVRWVEEADARAAEREAEREQIAREERERRAAFQREMEELLDVVLIDKGYQPSDARARRYQDYITFEFVYENRGEEDIRGFRGVVHFMDLFGETILELRLTVDQPLSAGQRRVDRGKVIEYNQFRDAHQRLRSTDFENLRVRWEPERILLADGRELSAGGG